MSENYSNDSLLESLLYIAAHHGRTLSREAIISGLPLEGKKLEPSLFPRAAMRAGLECQLFQRELEEIPSIVLPCIVFLKDRAVVVTEIDLKEKQLKIIGFSDGQQLASVSFDEFKTLYSGYAFFLRVRAEEHENKKEKKFEWFLEVVSKFKTNYVDIVISAFVINILALSIPLFTRIVYDRILPGYAISSLITLSIGVAIAVVFDFIMRSARSRMLDMTGKQVDVVLASKIYEHVMNLRMHSRPPRIGVLANQIRDFDSVREFFTSATLISITDLFFSFLFIFVIFFVAGPLGYIPMVLFPVVLAIGYLIKFPLDKSMRLHQAEASKKHGILIETLVGLETIKVMNAQATMQGSWERSVASSARASEGVHRWSSLAMMLSNTAQRATSLIMIIYGVVLVIDNQITVGGLIAANMLSSQILSPLSNIAAMIAKANQTMLSLKAIDEIMHLETDKKIGEVKTARHVERGEVEFRDVVFTYPGTTAPAIKNISFRINPGERVGIIGRVGSGKTTIGRLTVNLYSPDSGRILIDGADQRQYDPTDLRSNIGFVLQECDLFMGTLRHNIALGRPNASDEEILAVARLAGVDRFASDHPEGYEMRIAEGGRSLSGGQRQSVAIARVLLRRPRVLFLDEPTSAFDVHSEAEFCSKIDQMLGRDTTFLISTHRISLLNFVDRILVFDSGVLIADGPRDVVLEKMGRKNELKKPTQVTSDA